MEKSISQLMAMLEIGGFFCHFDNKRGALSFTGRT